jgi:hypothetical protein
MAGLVPAIPMMKSSVPHFIEITGTRPVMTLSLNFTSGTQSSAALTPHPTTLS